MGSHKNPPHANWGEPEGKGCNYTIVEKTIVEQAIVKKSIVGKNNCNQHWLLMTAVISSVGDFNRVESWRWKPL